MKVIQNWFGLLKREFGRFLRNKTLLSVFFLAPIIYAVLLAFVYQEGKVTEIPIIVVDKDATPLSAQVIEMLQDNEGIQVEKQVFELKDIKKEMIRNSAAAVIVIPDRFEADILQTRYPEIQIFCNTSNILTANFASKSIQQSLGTFAVGTEVKALQKRGMSYSQAMTKYEPFKQNYQKVFNKTGNYFTFMWPAMLAVVLQQVILLAMAVSFSTEFEEKTFNSELMDGRRFAIGAILIKNIPIWFFSVIIIGFFYLFHLLFNAPVPSQVSSFVVITGFFVVAVSLLGTVVSMLIPNALKATQILMIIASPSFIIGGYTWPLEAMPQGIQFFASIIPLTPFLNSFKILLIEGGELADCVKDLSTMGIQILVYGILSLLLIKWRMYKSKSLVAKEEK
ncbi:ABC transporter permease [Fluviicola taffensis]|uniref:ABC-2 type transporter n=1 Tax=Fluviicola taffensis (strain DSM 16823 / NCIMB 13979 / RW262) TaxID=755732 RepID=F2IJ06_FLUTR|nr:ABC transporter permease [Fluviicola taffensis]AEA43864.1 ABC-2 type transporter [Fluviicola taffensis DSM 16823]